MTKNQQLTALQGARAILDKSYCKWTNNDRKGGHCAQGAVMKQLGMGIGYSWANPGVRFLLLELMVTLGDSAMALHPELHGSMSPPNAPGAPDTYANRPYFFEVAPVVFINDFLGKEATLAVFDSAILELESELHATGELKIVDEIVTVRPAKPEITVMKFWPYMDEVVVHGLAGTALTGDKCADWFAPLSAY